MLTFRYTSTIGLLGQSAMIHMVIALAGGSDL